MWTYNKVLEYPINIKCTDTRLAKVIISQYGGPDGEIGASLRYLSQRFAMPDQNAKAILNDIRYRRISSFRDGWNYCVSID
jgi:spore coat protein JC